MELGFREDANGVCGGWGVGEVANSHIFFSENAIMRPNTSCVNFNLFIL